MSYKIPCPLEETEQTHLFAWARMQAGAYPELALLYHIPNGGSRHKIEAAKLKAQGVKAGVPDVFLPVARGDYHGLYIELKRQRGGTVSLDQQVWMTQLSKQGYKTVVCKGCMEAIQAITEYLRLGAKI